MVLSPHYHNNKLISDVILVSFVIFASSYFFLLKLFAFCIFGSFVITLLLLVKSLSDIVFLHYCSVISHPSDILLGKIFHSLLIYFPYYDCMVQVI